MSISYAFHAVFLKNKIHFSGVLTIQHKSFLSHCNTSDLFNTNQLENGLGCKLANQTLFSVKQLKKKNL